MGLRLYQNRQRSGMTELEKPTGETYSPNCTMKGMMKRKSRYFTLSAVMNKAGPRLVRIARATNAGSNAMRHVGVKPYPSIRTKSIARLTPKSTSATIADEHGMMTRGK